MYLVLFFYVFLQDTNRSTSSLWLAPRYLKVKKQYSLILIRYYYFLTPKTDGFAQKSDTLQTCALLLCFGFIALISAYSIFTSFVLKLGQTLICLFIVWKNVAQTSLYGWRSILMVLTNFSIAGYIKTNCGVGWWSPHRIGLQKWLSDFLTFSIVLAPSKAYIVSFKGCVRYTYRPSVRPTPCSSVVRICDWRKLN